MVYGIIFILFHALVLQTEWGKGEHRTQQMRAEQESGAEGTKWGATTRPVQAGSGEGGVSANL